MSKIEVKINALLQSIQNLVGQFGFVVVPEARLVDYVLYEYDSYEEYKNTQVEFNKIKIGEIWADSKTLERVKERIQENIDCNTRKINILCHGSRNGYEVKQLKKLLPNSEVLGTDISDTASDFDLIEWDFHDTNAAWVNHFDVIYTNSLDQSWNPKGALSIWLEQLKQEGLLVIEHTDAHSPAGASKMDPFGVRPVAFPFIVTKWFGDKVALSWTVAKKDNMDMDAYLFVIRKSGI